MPRSLRRILKWIRHGPDRLLHGRRLGRARHIIATNSPRSMVFVCHGNICRSPYAELVAQRMLGGISGIGITSVGFVQPGRPSPDEAIAAAREHGYDLRAHRSRPISNAVLAAADMVFVMEPGQRESVVGLMGVARSRVMLLGDLDPGPFTTRVIVDPIDKPVDSFRFCYTRIDRCVRELQRLLAAGPRR